jgi:hypothetical protein
MPGRILKHDRGVWGPGPGQGGLSQGGEGVPLSKAKTLGKRCSPLPPDELSQLRLLSVRSVIVAQTGS